MRYADYEAFLANLHSVDDGDRPAFTGRLRTLRDRAGVPVVPPLGKGKNREFTKVDLWETHLALKLAETGISPARIGVLFSRWMRPGNVFAKVRDYDGDNDLFMIILTYLNAGKGSETHESSHSVALRTIDEFADYFDNQRKNHAQIILNASKLIREVL